MAAKRRLLHPAPAADRRKDVLSFGDPAASGPYVVFEIYRPGSAGERFIDRRARSARIVAFTVTDDVKSAGQLDSKFGALSLVDFAIAAPRTNRTHAAVSASCGRSTPFMQLSGWYCSPGEEVVDRASSAARSTG